MRRFARFASGSTLVLAAGSFAPAAHADVIGTCQLNVPAQVRITSSYQHIVPTVSGTCAGYGSALSASWSGYTSQGEDDFLWFYGKTRTDWDVYDFETLGKHVWRPESAGESRGYNDFAQNTPSTDVRLGGSATLSATKSRSRVTLNGRGTRYSASWKKSIGWQTNATISYRPIGSSTWINLKTVPTSSTGSFSYSYTTSATREYRVWYAGNAQIWPATSGSVRK